MVKVITNIPNTSEEQMVAVVCKRRQRRPELRIGEFTRPDTTKSFGE